MSHMYTLPELVQNIACKKRKKRKEEKKMKKQEAARKKNHESLEVLVDLLNRKAQFLVDYFYGEELDDGFRDTDALEECLIECDGYYQSNLIPLNVDPLHEGDLEDLCFSNTTGAKSLFY